MKRTFWKKALTFALSAALAVSASAVAFADESQSTQSSMTIKEFAQAVVDASGTYDGNGVTITWAPSSGCIDGRPNHNCLFGAGENKDPDGNTPDRIQSSYAQYQLFGDLENVSISNVNFVCVQPKSVIKFCSNSGWQGTLDPETVKIMAEIQCLNFGNLSFTNCTFDNVTISPYGSGEGDTASFVSCRFSNVDKYAIKDIYAQNATVNNCSFDNCNGAIYFEGGTAKGNLSITNNSFSNIAERGMVQFSAKGDYGNANIMVAGNTGNVEVLFRELNDTVQSVTYDNPNLTFNKSKTDDSKKELLTASVGNAYYPSLGDAITAIGNQEATVTLGADCTENVVIPTGANITIDLNGHNITNKDTHTIINKGKLTITGNGTVDNINHGKAALYNDVGAEAVLNGGIYTRSQENGISKAENGGNSYYAILNHGKMEINERVSVIQNGHYSSLLENGWQDGSKNTTAVLSELTINGGTFSGGLNTIKNDDYGKIVIVDGTFTSVSQAAFLNWNIAEVRGGVFDATKATDAVILNGHINETMDMGILSISGGQFKGAAGKDCIVQMTGSGSIGTVTLSGGQFTSDVDTYCVPGYTTGNKKVTGSDYYQVHQHVTNLSATPAKEATCTEVGNKAYWECTVCHKLFADKDAKIEIKDATTLVIDPTGHKLTKTDAKAATCTEDGNIAHWKCSVCDKLFADEKAQNETTQKDVTISALGHDMTLVKGVDATTDQEGILAHYVCSRCGKWFWDKAATKEITNKKEVVIAKLPADTEGAKNTVVVPEQPQFVENESAPEAAKEVAKDLQVDEEAMAANGVAIAQMIQSNSENMEQAKQKLAEELGAPVEDTDTILLVVKPYLEVTPKKAELEGGIQKVELEITMKYNLQATIPGKTTVDLSKGNDMDKEQIKADTVVTVTLPESFTTSNGVIVRHDATANGYGIQYYISTVDSQNVTFKVPAEHGFSPFTLMSNSSVTVKLDGKNYTYTSRNVAEGTALPALSKNNYAFKGWKFDGIDGQHFNLTAELFEELLDKNTIVDAVSVFEGPLSEHPEIEEAKKNGTWGVDENKPAATAKPAAAAAVTPVRSSIPKTSDDSNLMLWVCLMGIAALGLGGAVYMKKRNHQ